MIVVFRFTITKRKCGADSVYPSEGCGKTYTRNKRINPHTRIDMPVSQEYNTP